MRRRKKGSKSYYKKKCDELFSKIVRSRGRCEDTGNTERLQCCHIISRSYHATRWDLDNAFCLTQGRHLYFTTHPLEWEEFVIKKIGRRKYNSLKKKARKLKQRKLSDYKELYKELKEEKC